MVLGMQNVNPYRLMSNSLLTIVINFYNHAKYVKNTIDSLLSQKTSFKFTILIHDDCSNDGTTDLLKHYYSLFPDKIELICQSENQYKKGVNVWAKYQLPLVKTKYVALCDGDDYWVDSNKLQKQVDFLEKNQDFVICYHRVYTINERMQMSEEELNYLNKPHIYTIEDLANGNFMHTPSVVFRNIQNLPKWYSEIKVGDYPLFMLAAATGKIYYMPDFMAVYRVHSGGIWSSINQKNRLVHWVEMLEYLIQEFSDSISVNTLLRKQYSKHCSNLSVLFLEESNSEDFEKYMERAIKADSASAKLYYNELSRLRQVEKQIQSSYLLRLARAIDISVRKFRVFHK